MIIGFGFRMLLFKRRRINDFIILMDKSIVQIEKRDTTSVICSDVKADDSTIQDHEGLHFSARG